MCDGRGEDGVLEDEVMKNIFSLLFVPARQKMLDKISTLDADVFIIDLEDSILPAEKDLALRVAIDFLNGCAPENFYVRVDKNRLLDQLGQLGNVSVRGFMVPKVESSDEVTRYAHYLKGRDVIALIETPRGLANVQSIAECPLVSALAFGAEDYTAFCGMENKHEYLLYHKSRIVMYAKANGKRVYDTPCFNLSDDDVATAETRSSAEMGFDGKLAIHPKMIPIIAREFNRCDLAYMKSIVEQYEASGVAVLKMDGKVFEKMHIGHFKRILQENNYN